MKVVDQREQFGNERLPNVLLITTEATRADHVGAYGYHRDTTPHFDALASEGALFLHYYAMVPRTAASLAAVMTSLYPTTSGVRTQNDRLDESRLTLAQILRQHGYATATTMLGRPHNVGLGFEDPLARQEDLVSDEAIRWIDAHRDRQFFLWLHYLQGHEPYENMPPRYFTLFGEPRPGFDERGLFESVRRGTVSRKKYYFETPYTSDERSRLIELYDSEIRYGNDEAERTIAHLDGLGLKDRTIIVWSSDHGEGLCDHGMCWEHGEMAYDDCLHIPLAIRYPPLVPARKRLPDLAMGIDLAPTILDMLGLPLHREMEGCSLLPILQGTAPPCPSRLLYEESDGNFWAGAPFRYFGGNKGKWRVMRDQRWKLILIPRPDEDRIELYDTLADPGETTNLAGKKPDVVKRFLTALRSWMERSGEEGDTYLIRKENEEELRALGYLQ